MNKTIHMLTVIAIMMNSQGEGQAVDTQNVEGETRTQCHQNSLERAGSSTRSDGGKHEW